MVIILLWLLYYYGYYIIPNIIPDTTLQLNCYFNNIIFSLSKASIP